MSRNGRCHFCFMKKVRINRADYNGTYLCSLCWQSPIAHEIAGKPVDNIISGAAYPINLLLNHEMFNIIPKEIKMLILQFAGIEIQSLEIGGMFMVKQSLSSGLHTRTIIRLPYRSSKI